MDRPKLLGDSEALKSRLSQLSDEHIAPLTKFVKRLRIASDSDATIPYFDPWDGGIKAEVLFLLEAPGAKAKNSGFVSMNNPDETAKNFFEISRETGIDRKRIITWNTVPWYIGSKSKIRPANSKDIAAGIRSLGELIQLLPRLRTVVLVGKKAQKAENHVRQLAPDLKIFKSPHPSPLFVNRKPENRAELLSIWTSVKYDLQTSNTKNMVRNRIDLELLSIAESIQGLHIHYQPKDHNRRWGLRRVDFKANSTAWIEPKITSNEFVIKPTGDFRRFMPELESFSQKVEQDQNRSVYYFKVAHAMRVFEILRPRT
ncbi:uracil-DNA glycosylase [Vibrio sp. 10N.222.55.A3]|uniref:uracil-DNA glycosylase n=1 Tax=unclassified Vibrio TaxID=2614977 RepID=UPI001E2D8097|nr:uracil-DNA glycosylase [Vibrio sp. F13]MCC4891712.1 uracil-DNA glycosylase [Vibrio sp. F13]